MSRYIYLAGLTLLFLVVIYGPVFDTVNQSGGSDVNTMGKLEKEGDHPEVEQKSGENEDKSGQNGDKSGQNDNIREWSTHIWTLVIAALISISVAISNCFHLAVPSFFDSAIKKLGMRYVELAETGIRDTQKEEGEWPTEEVEFTGKCWMSLIPDNAPLWMLSIAGTTGEITDNSTLLTSGMRFFDIRHQEFHEDDVADIASFLEDHTSEAVFVCVKDGVSLSHDKLYERIIYQLNSSIKGISFSDVRGKLVLLDIDSTVIHNYQIVSTDNDKFIDECTELLQNVNKAATECNQNDPKLPITLIECDKVESFNAALSQHMNTTILLKSCGIISSNHIVKKQIESIFHINTWFVIECDANIAAFKNLPSKYAEIKDELMRREPHHIALHFLSPSITRVLKKVKESDLQGLVSLLCEKYILTPPERHKLQVTVPYPSRCSELDVLMQNKSELHILKFADSLKINKNTFALGCAVEYMVKICHIIQTDKGSGQEMNMEHFESNTGEITVQLKNLPKDAEKVILGDPENFRKDLIKLPIESTEKHCIEIKLGEIDEWDLDNLKKDIESGVFTDRVSQWLAYKGVTIESGPKFSVDLHQDQNVIASHSDIPEDKVPKKEPSAEVFEKYLKQDEDLPMPHYIKDQKIGKNNKIIITIKEGYTQECEKFLEEACKHLFDKDIFKIREKPIIRTISPGSRICFMPTVNIKKAKSAEEPLKLLDFPFRYGTIGGFLKDQNMKIYAMTSQHLLTTSPGFYNGYDQSSDEEVLLKDLTAVSQIYQDNTIRIMPIGSNKVGLLKRCHSYELLTGTFLAHARFEDDKDNFLSIDILLVELDNEDNLLDKAYFQPLLWESDNTGKEIDLVVADGDDIKVGTRVQKIGAASGYTVGVICDVELGEEEEGHTIGKRGFTVKPDEGYNLFAHKGDSGSLVTTINIGKRKVLGIVHMLIGDKSICVNFKHNLEELNRRMDKYDRYFNLLQQSDIEAMKKNKKLDEDKCT